MTLPMAGFCSSGIFGIDGICTKLKYHSKPIHITPLITWSQRITKAPHAWSYFAVLTARIKMISSTTPAITVRPNDCRIAPILVLLFAKDGDYSQTARRGNAGNPGVLRVRESHARTMAPG